MRERLSDEYIRIGAKSWGESLASEPDGERRAVSLAESFHAGARWAEAQYREQVTEPTADRDTARDLAIREWIERVHSREWLRQDFLDGWDAAERSRPPQQLDDPGDAPRRAQVEFDPGPWEPQHGEPVGCPISGACACPQPEPIAGTADLVERLAAWDHSAWAHWTEYMLDNLTEENIARWRRQIATLYADLSEKEKDSDRKEAREIVALLGPQPEPPERGKPARFVFEPDDDSAEPWSLQSETCACRLSGPTIVICREYEDRSPREQKDHLWNVLRLEQRIVPAMPPEPDWPAWWGHFTHLGDLLYSIKTREIGAGGYVFDRELREDGSVLLTPVVEEV